jgi:glycosyltransferase involved in cell wall biosynthesis
LRIVFITHEFALNGAVIALLEQARFLRRRGHFITIAAPPLDGRLSALATRFEAEGARITSSFNPSEHDVVVGNTVFAADHLQHMLGQLPVVWWIHEGRAGVRHVLNHPAGLRLLTQAHTLVFPSRNVADQLYAPLLPGPMLQRVEVVPSIVPPPPPGGTATKPDGSFRVLCVGSVYPRKRQVDLLRAITMLGDAPVECILAGETYKLAPPGPSIVETTPERFKLTGGLAPEDLARLYRSADVFSLPSEDEASPIAPVEAAWHGVPVVLSDLPCYAGIWYQGYNALIHPVGDAEMLAWHIRMLLASPSLRQQLTTNARQTAARFSAERNGGLFEAVLSTAAGGGRAANASVPTGTARFHTPKVTPGNPTGSLTELANRFRSDKGSAYGTPPHRYTLLYDLLFHPMRDKPITLLEIGLAIGGPELGGPVNRRIASPSVAMWLEYFPKAHIVGFDISDFSHLEHSRFAFVRGDSGNSEDLERVASVRDHYDIILDDGSHASYHQQLALKVLFPRLVSGGLYVIEDLHWQSPFYERGLPFVPKTGEFLSRYLLDGHYIPNELLPAELMRQLAGRIASFAVFPDFTVGSGAKLIIIRAQ